MSEPSCESSSPPTHLPSCIMLLSTASTHLSNLGPVCHSSSMERRPVVAVKTWVVPGNTTCLTGLQEQLDTPHVATQRSNVPACKGAGGGRLIAPLSAHSLRFLGLGTTGPASRSQHTCLHCTAVCMPQTAKVHTAQHYNQGCNGLKYDVLPSLRCVYGIVDKARRRL